MSSYVHIPTPKVACPYCGNLVTPEISLNVFGEKKEVRQLARCGDPESAGCGRDFVISGSVNIEFPHRCLKIEGQEA